MFENQTFEAIMERQLKQIAIDIDKREGSVIYNALAPAAAELAQAYIWLDQILKLASAESASGEFLDRRVADFGIERQKATKAIRAVQFTGGVSVPVGARFMLENESLYFVYREDGTLECETAGSIGNVNMTGQILLPLNTIPGLQTATIQDLLIPGKDVETDDNLRKRHFTQVRREAVSANKQHYKKWAEEVEGVGKAKVFPLFNGDGTVKIVITNAQMEPATQTLIDKVKQYIDPSDGKGEGQAPIGAHVTVESALWKDIVISAKVLPNANITLEQVRTDIEQSILALLRKNAFENSFIKISQINNIIYNSQYVNDYADIKINGKAENLELKDIDIPALREVKLIEQTE